MTLFFMQMILYYIHNQHQQLNLLSDNLYMVVDIPAPEQFPYTKAFAHKDHRLFLKHDRVLKKDDRVLKKRGGVGSAGRLQQQESPLSTETLRVTSLVLVVYVVSGKCGRNAP